jgi:hypothetical protein
LVEDIVITLRSTQAPGGTLITYGGHHHDLPLLRQACLRTGVVLTGLEALMGLAVEAPSRAPTHIDLAAWKNGPNATSASLADLYSALGELMSPADVGRQLPDPVEAVTCLFLLYLRWLAITGAVSSAGFRSATSELWGAIERSRVGGQTAQRITDVIRSDPHRKLSGDARLRRKTA